MAQAIDRPDRFGSSDEDEDSAAWLEGSKFDGDYSSPRNKKGPRKFGFEDRFDEFGKGYRNDSPDSEDDVSSYILRVRKY